METILNKNKKAVHTTACEDCKNLGLNFYVVKSDRIIAAASKKYLRKYRQQIYSSGNLPYDAKNPETWHAYYATEWTKKEVAENPLRRWLDKLHAQEAGLPIPE